MKASTQRIRLSADGIRGIAFQWPLTPEGSFMIGCALGQYLKKRYARPTAVVGRDTRPSSSILAEYLQRGLATQNARILNLGIMTTPGVAFLTRYEEAQFGIVVSASHSVAKYNGVKWVGSDGLRLTEDVETEILGLLNAPDHDGASMPETTAANEQADTSDLIEYYIQEQVRLCGLSSLKGLKLVLDCANGATSYVAPEIFNRLNADVIAINASMVDGEIINDGSGAENARENPKAFIATVKQHRADYGFAFDGDGDRLVVVDENGNIFNGDDFLFVLATHYESRGLLRGHTIVTTNMANTGLYEALINHNVMVVFAANGDKHLEQQIWRKDYYLGAEQIGNVIINDRHHAAADSVYAALALIRATHHEGKSLLQSLSGIHKRPQVLATVWLTGEEPPWTTKDMPVRLGRELERQKQSSIKKLGEGARIITWRSTTEPEKFQTMVEGGLHVSLDEVQHQADAICRTIQRNALSDSREPAIVDLSSRQRA